MNRSKLTQPILAIVAIALLTAIAGCDQPQQAPSAASPSPAGDLTALEFEGDYPTAETTANLDRYQDFSFATTIAFWAQPFMELSLIHI